MPKPVSGIFCDGSNFSEQPACLAFFCCAEEEYQQKWAPSSQLSVNPNSVMMILKIHDEQMFILLAISSVMTLELRHEDSKYYLCFAVCIEMGSLSMDIFQTLHNKLGQYDWPRFLMSSMSFVMSLEYTVRILVNFMLFHFEVSLY